MKTPQKEDGYTGIANELWKAINRAGFSGGQRKCLDLILRLCYGCGKNGHEGEEALVERLSDFAAAGIRKQNIRKNVGDLIGANVIRISRVEREDGLIGIRFNKNYRSWRVNFTGNDSRYDVLVRINLGNPQITPKAAPKREKVIHRLPKSNPQITPTQSKPSNDAGLGRPKQLKKEDKISLSLITGFYRSIGQKRMSRQKRERAEEIFRKLRQEGFTPEDIEFAIKWTLENAREPPYDFSIIQHTIGQAIAAREKEESRATEALEQERVEMERRAEQEREEQEREELEAYKQSLSLERREELRKQAEADLKESGKYKHGFITELLIAIRENEILREERRNEEEAT